MPTNPRARPSVSPSRTAKKPLRRPGLVKETRNYSPLTGRLRWRLRRTEAVLDSAGDVLSATAQAAKDTNRLLQQVLQLAGGLPAQREALDACQKVFQAIEKLTREKSRAVDEFLACGPGDDGGDDPNQDVGDEEEVEEPEVPEEPPPEGTEGTNGGGE